MDKRLMFAGMNMSVNINIEIALMYYAEIAEKNSAEVEKYLHPEVCVISPFGETIGKEQVFAAIQKFMHMFKTIHIRAQCGSEDYVMLAYDLSEFGNSMTTLRAASLMTFKDGLIIRNELFFDTRSL